MTEPLFFDTDCISAFLWVKEQSILVKMFPGRIGIPRQTYEELSIPEIPHLKSRVDQLIEGGQAQIVDINFDTEAYELYYRPTEAPTAIELSEKVRLPVWHLRKRKMVLLPVTISGIFVIM